MSGEALTTDASLTMDLVLQFLGRHLHDGDAPMRELVDELCAIPALSRPPSIGRAYRGSCCEQRLGAVRSNGAPKRPARFYRLSAILSVDS